MVSGSGGGNSGKADSTLDELGWHLLGQADVQGDRDGLTGGYQPLRKTAGEPDAPYHGWWLRALGGP